MGYLNSIAHSDAHEAIMPFHSQLIHSTIQLVHGDGLRVQHICVDRLIEWVRQPFFIKILQRLSQNL